MSFASNLAGQVAGTAGGMLGSQPTSYPIYGPGSVNGMTAGTQPLSQPTTTQPTGGTTPLAPKPQIQTSTLPAGMMGFGGTAPGGSEQYTGGQVTSMTGAPQQGGSAATNLLGQFGGVMGGTAPMAPPSGMQMGTGSTLPPPVGSGSTGTAAGSSIGGSQPFVNPQNLTQTAGMVQNQAQNVANLPNLSNLSNQYLNSYMAQTDPYFQRTLRGVGEQNAAMGRMGSGITTSQLGDVTAARQRDLDTLASQLALQSAQGQTGANIASLNALSGLQGQQFGQNEGLAQTGIQNAVQQAELEAQLQNQGFQQGMQQTGALTNAGYLQNPNALLLAGSGQNQNYAGQLGAQNQQSAMMQAYLQAMQGMGGYGGYGGYVNPSTIPGGGNYAPGSYSPYDPTGGMMPGQNYNYNSLGFTAAP